MSIEIDLRDVDVPLDDHARILSAIDKFVATSPRFEQFALAGTYAVFVLAKWAASTHRTLHWTARGAIVALDRYSSITVALAYA